MTGENFTTTALTIGMSLMSLLSDGPTVSLERPRPYPRDQTGLVRSGTFAAVRAFFDVFLVVVPLAPCIGEHSGQHKATGKDAKQQFQHAWGYFRPAVFRVIQFPSKASQPQRFLGYNPAVTRLRIPATTCGLSSG